MMILGIAGEAGSGKDTVADWFVENKGFQKIGLADPMKRFCREVFGFEDEDLWGSSERRMNRKKGVTARHALQHLGTEWGRNMTEDLWVDYLFEQAKVVLAGGRKYVQELGLVGNPFHDKPPAGIVVSDVRFLNEVAKIRGAGGRVILTRGSYKPLQGDAAAHVSEHTDWNCEHYDAAIGPFPEEKGAAFTTLERICSAFGI